MKNHAHFSSLILNWYKTNKRDLPWRKTKDPYKIWVSEIILQQTQVIQGVKYYINFIKKFPDIESLSKAAESDILKAWEGLGYYSRAINMLNNAKLLNKQKPKIFPNNFDELIKLKGIGEYTASAISSICNNEKKAVLDGNVFRVISRVFNISTPINSSSGKKIFNKITYDLLPKKSSGDYNQGLMDFGAIQCTIKNPKCNYCPIKKMCQSFKLKKIELRPVKIKNERIKKIRKLNYFIINFQHHLYIQKRLKKDIWRNLYEPLLFESKENSKTQEKNIKNKLKTYFNEIEIQDFFLSKKTTHQLSHQTLNIFFWEITCSKLKQNQPDNLFKVPFAKISTYPFPKPITKYLTKFLIT